MTPRTIWISAITTIVFLIACGNRDDLYTVEIVDGVRTVHNIKPLWGDEPQVELELVRVYGGGVDDLDDLLNFLRVETLLC